MSIPDAVIAAIKNIIIISKYWLTKFLSYIIKLRIEADTARIPAIRKKKPIAFIQSTVTSSSTLLPYLSTIKMQKH